MSRNISKIRAQLAELKAVQNNIAHMTGHQAHMTGNNPFFPEPKKQYGNMDGASVRQIKQADESFRLVLQNTDPNNDLTVLLFAEELDLSVIPFNGVADFNGVVAGAGVGISVVSSTKMSYNELRKYIARNPSGVSEIQYTFNNDTEQLSQPITLYTKNMRGDSDIEITPSQYLKDTLSSNQLVIINDVEIYISGNQGFAVTLLRQRGGNPTKITIGGKIQVMNNQAELVKGKLPLGINPNEVFAKTNL